MKVSHLFENSDWEFTKAHVADVKKLCDMLTSQNGTAIVGIHVAGYLYIEVKADLPAVAPKVADIKKALPEFLNKVRRSGSKGETYEYEFQFSHTDDPSDDKIEAMLKGLVKR
jgi:hypothetical protein